MTAFLMAELIIQGFIHKPGPTLIILYVIFGIGFGGTGTVVWLADQAKKSGASALFRSKTVRVVAFLLPVVFWPVYGLYRFVVDVLFDETTT